MMRTLSLFALLFLASAAAAEDLGPYSPANQLPQMRRDLRLVHAAASEPTSANHAAEHALLEQKLAELDRLQKEIDELRRTTGTPQQILVRFQVLEVSRTKLRKLGVDFATADADAGKQRFIMLTGVQQASLGFGTVGPDNESLVPSSALQGFLDALRQNNVARVLAEPNLVVVSGRPASFHVGGEIPVPPPQNGATANVGARKFGTQVDVLAVTLGQDRVRLELRMSVSEPDFGSTTIVEGQRVPLINLRQCDTAATLAFSQSTVLGGMIQQRTMISETDAGRTTEPIETELLFIVTPEAVK